LLAWPIATPGAGTELYVQTSILIFAGGISFGWAVAVVLIRWLLQPRSAPDPEGQGSYRCGGIKAS
jgi:hypothetical protein